MSAHQLHAMAFSFGGGEGDSGEPPTPAGRPSAGDLLRDWRAAERDLAGLEPGSAAWRRLQAEIERLRERYQEAFASHSTSDPTGSSAQGHSWRHPDAGPGALGAPRAVSPTGRAPGRRAARR